MINVQEVLSDIQAYATSPLKESRVISDIAVDQWVRQGDVYVMRINDFDKSNYKIDLNRQLPPGNTPGSRHTVDEYTKVYVSKNKNSDVITQKNGFTVLGPIVESDTRWTLSHPQHADFSLPAGTYQVSYQIDPQRMAMVLD